MGKWNIKIINPRYVIVWHPRWPSLLTSRTKTYRVIRLCIRFCGFCCGFRVCRSYIFRILRFSCCWILPMLWLLCFFFVFSIKSCWNLLPTITFTPKPDLSFIKHNITINYNFIGDRIVQFVRFWPITSIKKNAFCSLLSSSFFPFAFKMLAYVVHSKILK